MRATAERAGQPAAAPLPDPSLADQPAAGAAAGSPPSTPGTGDGRGAAETDCPARHCWVTAPVDATQARPGLLWEWRRVENGRFEGLVSYPARLRPGRWATVTEWVPAELLSQL